MALYICSAVEQALDWTKHCSIVKWQDWSYLCWGNPKQPSEGRTELQNIRFIKNQVSDLNLKIHKKQYGFKIWQYGSWSFQTGGTKLERINILKGNFWILRIGSMGASEVFKNQSFESQLFSSFILVLEDRRDLSDHVHPTLTVGSLPPFLRHHSEICCKGLS